MVEWVSKEVDPQTARRLETEKASPLSIVVEYSTQRYYCFSAGCLGAVTALSNITLEMVLDVALNIQRQWKGWSFVV